jgi:cytochrome b561
MRKSSSDRYGSVAVSLHWLSAVLIVALLAVGLLAADTADAHAKANLLRLRVPVGLVVLLLTLFRIVWWWRYYVKPHSVEDAPRWQQGLARAVHVALYVRPGAGAGDDRCRHPQSE